MYGGGSSPKCSNKRPGRLFNFLGREGGANSKGSAYWKGGAYFVFLNFGLKMTQSLVFETQTVTHKNVKENCFLVKQGIFEFCRRWLKSLEAKKKLKDGPVIPENLRATWIFLSKK